MRNATRRLLVLALIQTGLIVPITPQARANTVVSLRQSETRNGLRTTTFDTPQGRVRVNLPDDMRAGDTISGTVVAEPKSDGSLSGYVVDIAGTSGPATPRVFKIVVPAGPAMVVVLKNASGGDVDRATVPIIGSRGTTSQFALPRIGQTGRPLEIPGPFDGDSSNTRVNVGGMRTPIIAESPRKAVIEIPLEPTGNTNITITDRGKVGTSGFRIVGVSLSAPKTQLKKGEKTTLSVRLVGLEGIKNEVAVHLETKGVVETEGGNTQQMKIQPNQVQPDGTATLTRTITGVSPGNFTVIATVMDPTRNPN